MLCYNEVCFISLYLSSEGKAFLGIITVTGPLSKVKLHLDKEKGVQKGSQNFDPAYSCCFSTRRPCLLIFFASEHYLVKTELCLRRKRHDSLKMLLRTKSATETEFTRKARHVAKRHFLNYSCITNQPKYFCLNNAKDSK